MKISTLNREIKMAELDRIKMETEKLQAEKMKLYKEAIWYPAIPITLGLLGLIIAILK